VTKCESYLKCINFGGYLIWRLIDIEKFGDLIPAKINTLKVPHSYYLKL